MHFINKMSIKSCTAGLLLPLTVVVSDSQHTALLKESLKQ